jgi:hypothetical protein
MTQKENKAVLVAIGNSQHAEVTQEHLDELAFLAETAGHTNGKEICSKPSAS